MIIEIEREKLAQTAGTIKFIKECLWPGKTNTGPCKIKT